MESTSNRRPESAIKVVEVLPGSRFLFLLDSAPDALPDPDELGDLRYHARKMVRSPVLDLGVDEAFLVQAVITAIVSGVLSPAVWSPFPAAGRWIERTIRRRGGHPELGSGKAGSSAPRPETNGAERASAGDFDPVARADELVRAILRSLPGPMITDVVEVTNSGGSLWTVTLTVSNRWSAEVAMSIDGTIGEVAIAPLGQPSRS